MSKILTLDEAMIALFHTNRLAYDIRAAQLVDIGNDIADDLAATLGIQAGFASYDDGGLMMGFRPMTPEQPVPDAIAEYDTESDWRVDVDDPDEE